jgi:hypothetical protein
LILVFMAYQRPGARVIASEFEWQTVGRCVLRAMVRPGRDSLRGTVEVDETYVGGVEKGKRGRETETKAIVAVAAEENGKGIGRIRLRRVKDVSGASLLPFVQSAAVKGAPVQPPPVKSKRLALPQARSASRRRRTGHVRHHRRQH